MNMPEFILDGAESHLFRDLPDILKGYIEAAAFTAEEGDPWGFYDLASETRERMRRDCARFEAANAGAIAACGLDDQQVGRDLWYSRNGHGTGFWDREGPTAALAELDAAARALGETSAYRGDDGRIHLG